ncbi:Hypothetical predicted protein [Pelobates cultripes]|uniref:Uncharacterized protein n=1 Tax=Pelobates cultripes TaxID=61616 RepID=A0AAD1SY10_PELCU|nr:Hypothetical predicted protein [Pelobates cultripes]
MAAGPEPPKELMDAPDAIQEALQPDLPMLSGDLKAPATRGDIVNLLSNFRSYFRADLAVLQEEVMAFTNWVKMVEEDVSLLAQRQTGTVEEMQVIQAFH